MVPGTGVPALTDVRTHWPQRGTRRPVSSIGSHKVTTIIQEWVRAIMKWCSRPEEVQKKRVCPHLLNQVTQCLHPKMPVSRCYQSCKEPQRAWDVTLFTSHQVRRAEFHACWQETQDSWVRGKDFIIIHARQAAWAFACLHRFPLLPCPQGNADGCTQLSKKNAKAERTGLCGNSVMFL